MKSWLYLIIQPVLAQTFEKVSPLKGENFNKTSFTNIFELIAGIINILLLIGGIAALIMVILGGIRYIMAGGDPEKATQARSALMAALVGFILIAASYSIILYIVERVFP